MDEPTSKRPSDALDADDHTVERIASMAPSLTESQRNRIAQLAKRADS